MSCRKALAATVAPDDTYKVLAFMVSVLVIVAAMTLGAVIVSCMAKLPFSVVLTGVTPSPEANVAGTTEGS